MSKVANVVSVSGGKDSQATALLAAENPTEGLQFVFADTGHEHQITYDHIAYLDVELQKRCGVGITVVRAQFGEQMRKKAEYVRSHWFDDLVAEGWSSEAAQDKVDRALHALDVPTGNPFEDLVRWKGRFPSTRRRFCSVEMKHKPIHEQVVAPLIDQGVTVISWQGVRRDESRARSQLPQYDVEFGQWEPTPQGLLIYRPIIDWTAADVFDYIRASGTEPNPLYKMGMGRVGCFPCIHATKREVLELADRFPEQVDRMVAWEERAADASKRDSATFMDVRNLEKRDTRNVSHKTHGFLQYVRWSRTSRGGKNLDLFMTDDREVEQCSSIYGLCE